MYILVVRNGAEYERVIRYIDSIFNPVNKQSFTVMLMLTLIGHAQEDFSDVAHAFIID
jgi:hypothetical protein